MSENFLSETAFVVEEEEAEEILAAPLEIASETPYNHLNALREDVSELKVPFDKVRDEINSKLMKGSERMAATEKLYTAAANMTQTLQQKYTNASNEQKGWKDVKVKLATTLLKEKITLNVGGNRYITSLHTLTRENDTYFTEIFSKDWKSELDDVDKSIFIDRNGEIFTYILEYLRTDAVSDDVLLDEILQHNLMIEAKHFRLQNLVNVLTKTMVENTFPNGTLLGVEHKKKLNEFYGKPEQRWELIYKASRDGFDTNAFHTRCNNQGPTFTIIQSNNGYLFGGYTAVAFTSDCNYKNDTTAFLFTLTNPHDIAPTKYLINPANVGNAVYHHSSYGPFFGTGAISLSNSSNSSNSSIGFPNVYIDTTGKGSATFTGGSSFLTSEIEVFKLA
jgi:hypothetical protein